jgi:hypothetical protein
MKENQRTNFEQDQSARRSARRTKEVNHKRKLDEENRAAIPSADESMVLEYIRKRIEINPQDKE